MKMNNTNDKSSTRHRLGQLPNEPPNLNRCHREKLNNDPGYYYEKKESLFDCNSPRSTLDDYQDDQHYISGEIALFSDDDENPTISLLPRFGGCAEDDFRPETTVIDAEMPFVPYVYEQDSDHRKAIVEKSCYDSFNCLSLVDHACMGIQPTFSVRQSSIDESRERSRSRTDRLSFIDKFEDERCTESDVITVSNLPSMGERANPADGLHDSSFTSDLSCGTEHNEGASFWMDLIFSLTENMRISPRKSQSLRNDGVMFPEENDWAQDEFHNAVEYTLNCSEKEQLKKSSAEVMQKQRKLLGEDQYTEVKHIKQESVEVVVFDY